MRFILFTIIFISFSSGSFACINGESLVLKSGEVLYEDWDAGVPAGHEFHQLDYKSLYPKLDRLYQQTKDLAYLSDKGYLLIVQGRLDEAIALYLHIEQLSPGRYATASNIGTAYELDGENEKALYWIKRALEIDPASHYASEWIHVRILEEKIRNPQHPDGRHLIGTDFGNRPRPYTELSHGELEQLEKQLFYQLNERISFVKPKDPIVAQLLFDLANISYALEKKTASIDIYEGAIQYGYNGSLAKTRIRLAESIQEKEEQNFRQAEQTKTYYTNVLFFASVLLSILLLWGIMAYVKWARIKQGDLD